ncbi:glucose-1-phosphate adenylyltransferase [Actinokineospora globicatena]|uniref:Glucose-1-phosphate adenylyltransferase n=1 Tax=Actinokineospora globicatena TaxID=103729 RepID=A0A9W6VB60_9PSEU|nr:glucose-1-phosphate adenylyltransferase [Actinokineospora globicatena]MCP2300451.1 glucose-1-phosphate adenylyltransferase [Actinokineospora globicatena]GLW80985.1 glucose-1-phosphate adenylyltransferase [Actinokineospora globicatena]GLW88178.1 glucose-1-phosphate adenylyltransferase [Actinokineospora globicatena]GLW92658.1 glucose-1-phosphate adenylyltransferase [Actinokineospora globicatena]
MKGKPRVLGIVLAGGEGKRLWPLTADRAKPAVPFAGNYRLVDFVLSNLVNAGFHQLCVLTQYKSHSLDRHISTTWRLSNVLGQYVTPVPAQQRLGPRWYTGSADAIFQSLNLVNDEQPDHIAVFGADHVYRMDPGQMLEQHVDSGAGVTVAGIRVPRLEARAFGCIDSDANRKITSFLEKPDDPPSVPDDPDVTFASMGNYLFSTSALVEALRADAADRDSMHDMGGDIIPMLVDQGDAYVYDFADNVVPGETERDKGYWRDVGTLDAFYDAHMDLVSVHPVFNLYNRQWPIRTATPPLPPAKFVNSGTATESIVGPGSVISGATVTNSVISADVVIEDGAVVEGSVLLPGARVGKGAVVRKAILDKNVVVADGVRLGVDLESDRERYTVSASGVVVLGKGARAD